MKLSSVLLSEEQVSKIDGGAWIEVKVYGNDDEIHTLNMKLRGMESVVYQNARTELLLEIGFDEKDAKANYRLEGLAMARGLIVDWDMRDEAGDKVPWTVSEGEVLLTNRGALRFQNAIRGASTRIAKDGRATIEELAKN